MSAWPHDWPDEVQNFYSSLAATYQWSQDTIVAFTASVEYVRRLDESDRARVYFSGHADGARWLFETVQDGVDLAAIRQILINDDDGVVHRYSWRRLEDDFGGLTDQAVVAEGGVERSGPAEFIEAWADGI